MKLNGYHRIGVILYVIWIILVAAFFYNNESSIAENSAKAAKKLCESFNGISMKYGAIDGTKTIIVDGKHGKIAITNIPKNEFGRHIKQTLEPLGFIFPKSKLTPAEELELEQLERELGEQGATMDAPIGYKHLPEEHLSQVELAIGLTKDGKNLISIPRVDFSNINCGAIYDMKYEQSYDLSDIRWWEVLLFITFPIIVIIATWSPSYLTIKLVNWVLKGFGKNTIKVKRSSIIVAVLIILALVVWIIYFSNYNKHKEKNLTECQSEIYPLFKERDVKYNLAIFSCMEKRGYSFVGNRHPKYDFCNEDGDNGYISHDCFK